jgi:hypothetical protein
MRSLLDVGEWIVDDLLGGKDAGYWWLDTGG